jgi:phage/plasmid-associated DNA primase
MRFSGDAYHGRRLVHFDEVNVKRAQLGSQFGNLVTGETISIERKRVQGIVEVRNVSKVVLTANELPDSAEYGIYRRMILIRLKQSFYDNLTVDQDMLNKLKAESSGILNRMIRGLHHYRKLGTFSVIEGHEAEIEDYKESSDVFSEFLSTYFEVSDNENDQYSNAELHKAFIESPMGRTYDRITPARFSRRISSQPLQSFSKIERVKGAKGIRYWKYLKLKKGYELIDGVIKEDAYVRDEDF